VPQLFFFSIEKENQMPSSEAFLYIKIHLADTGFPGIAGKQMFTFVHLADARIRHLTWGDEQKEKRYGFPLIDFT
jgi:hypothetical protein